MSFCSNSFCLAIINLVLLFIVCSYGIDGQSDPMSEAEAEAIYKDPQCSRPTAIRAEIDWSNIRYLNLIEFAPSILKSDTFANHWDEIAHDCLFGMITLFYYAAYHSLLRGDAASAMVYYTWLDGYYSGVHPGLYKLGDWGVSDDQIGGLRRELIPKAMRKKDAAFRVYVYTESDCPLIVELTQGASFCAKGQWGSEVHIHDFFIGSEYRTFDPNEADWFFVPGYGICMFEGGFIPIKRIQEIYIELSTGCLPFWQDQGQRHIFTFASGMSVSLFRDWRNYISKATFLTPETGLFNDFSTWQTQPDFNPTKDIVIPGHLHRSEVFALVHSAQPIWSQRPFLAVFFGKVDPSRESKNSGSPRHELMNMLKDPSQWPEGFPHDVIVGSNLTPNQMYEYMGSAKYCLIPRGKSEWSLRLFEALFAGCVPVMLADGWKPLPFTQVEEGNCTAQGLQESQFVLRMPSVLVKSRELIDNLRIQDEQEMTKLLASIKQIRCGFLYGHPLAPTHMQERHVSLHQEDFCGNSKLSALDGIIDQLKRLTHTHKNTT